MILQSEHRDPIIIMVHVHTNIHGCTKYEQDLLNIVCYKAVRRAGWTDGQTAQQCHLVWVGWG